MAHHSSEHPLYRAQRSQAEAIFDALSPSDEDRHEESLGNLTKQFGATGHFPEGKLTDHDEGEIRFGIAAREGKIIIDFGKPVRSLGMNIEQAWQVIESLRSKIEEARTQR